MPVFLLNRRSWRLFWSGSALNSIQALKLPMKFVIPEEGAVEDLLRDALRLLAAAR